MGSKPFTPICDQLQILVDRGLKIEDKEYTKTILLRENYYNVINGYKKPFLKRELNGKLVEPEEYVEGCSFFEIYSLHNIDRELRLHILRYLLKFEAHFKTSCAYNFSNKYREPYSYLNLSNYSNEKELLSKTLRNIASLSAEVNKNTNARRPKSPYIGHYIDKHDSVPLWVLVNSLTIGNMSYFYSALDAQLKETIAKDFSKQYKTDYGSKEKVEVEALIQIVKMVNLFRNVCAHEEVLFLFKLDRKIKSNIFMKYFKDDSIEQMDVTESDLFTLILLIKIVIPKNDYLELIEGLEQILNKYRGNFKSVEFDKIISLSGFKSDWEIAIKNNL